MPDDATDVSVLRIVVREGFSADLARALHDDAITALAHLDKLKPGGHFDERSTSRTSLRRRTWTCAPSRQKTRQQAYIRRHCAVLGQSAVVT